MNGLKSIYKKNKNLIENRLFPVLLFLYPFIGVCQGLTVADSTYSLANFQYFGQMDGTWMVATFLSNAWGSLLMRLPFGGTIIGMNCYTAPVQSAMALMSYLALRKKMPAPLLFLGEVIALGLCWAPSVILYQNLTYFFMTAGILLLYRGLSEDGGTSVKGRRLYFTAAGLCLGANVAVRMPNVVHAALILVVWYGIVICYQRKNGRPSMEGSKTADGPTLTRTLMVSTGWCLAGYLAGFGLPLLAICLRYGLSAYPDMVRTMFAMTEQATDYKPTSMLTGMFGDYGRGLYWLAFAAVCMAAAWLALLARQRLYGEGKTGGRSGHVRETTGIRRTDALAGKENAYKITGEIIKAGYCLLLVVLLRFYWGRGMFAFCYYNYTGIYYPTVLLLLVTIVTAVYCLMKREMAAEKKILAAAVLLEIFLTPLGSNNKLYPIINNLFLAVPFLLWTAYDKTAADNRTNGGPHVSDALAEDAARGEEGACAPAFLWQFPLVGLVFFLLVQSIGFHVSFAFNDGVFGEPRDMRVTLPEKAAGVWTNRERGTLLEELARFVDEEGLTGRKVICYGEIPGLSYLLDMPPALSTGWPDLASYRMAEYLRDMEAVEAKGETEKKLPVVIVSTPVAAYLSDDGEAIAWFGVDMEACAADEKLQLLGAFLGEHGYAECFGNAGYVVYCAE